MGEHLKFKKKLRDVSCPKAQFIIHKNELRTVVMHMNSSVKKPWWNVSIPRVALATVVTMGVIAGVFIIGPMNSVSTSKVLASAEENHQQRGESGRFYYAKEKIVTYMPENESALFLEMHEDVKSGDVYTRMYDHEGRMIDEHAIIAKDFFVCVECIQEQIFSESSVGDLVFVGIPVEAAPKDSISQRLYNKILSLQSNPSMTSRSSLFEELKSGVDTSYAGTVEWNDVLVEQIDLIEQENSVQYKTAFYFEKDTYDFKGSDDFISAGDVFEKIGSREILEESYSNQEFKIDSASLQRVVFE